MTTKAIACYSHLNIIDPFGNNGCPVCKDIFILEELTSIKIPVFQHMVHIFSAF